KPECYVLQHKRETIFLLTQYSLKHRIAPTHTNRAKWGSRSKRRHAKLGMTLIIPSTGSCQVLCVSLDVATIVRIMASHDREGREVWSSARHEREILSIEDEKDQK